MCTLILNFEGAWKPIERSKNREKKILLEQSKDVCVSNTKNIYYSIYNNHTTDFGLDGIRLLLKNLTPPNSRVAKKINDSCINIHNQKFVFLGDTKEGVLCQKLNLIKFNQSSINKNRHLFSNAHVIVHGGLEYRKDPTPYQRFLAHFIMGLGAQSVIFHHSHIEGSYETVDGKLIHYGLGNFFFSETAGLHGHEHDTRLMVKFDENGSWGFYKLSDNYSLERVQIPPTKYPDSKKYSAWYRSHYSVDPGFRPRQLFHSDFVIHMQFMLWSLCARQFVRLGISKKIKEIVKNVLR